MRHIVWTFAIVTGFFVLLWLGVFVFDQSPPRAMLLAILTVALLITGASYTASTLRADDERRRE